MKFIPKTSPHIRALLASFLGSVLLSGCGGGGAADAPANNATKSAGSLGVEQLLVPTPAPNVVVSPVVEAPKTVLVPPSTLAPETDPVVKARLELQRTQQRLGANMGGVRPYSRTHEFVDLVRSAVGFGSFNSYGSSDAPVGPDGWPTGDFSIQLLHDQKEVTGISGTYTLVYDGQADVSALASPIVIKNRRVDPDTKANLADIEFPVGGSQMGLNFKLLRGTDGKALAPVKNLRVIRPEYASQWRNPPIFTANYLRHIQRFSTLRFMDWLDTNVDLGKKYDGPEGVWEKRPTPITKRVATGDLLPRGMPWETIIELANEAKVDIWINVPPLANDAYVTALAKLMKDGLKHNQRVYVEYGNEMWNYQFKQAHKLADDAVAEAKAGSEVGLRINYDKKDPVVQREVMRYRLYMDRLIRISDAFRAEFGDDQMMTRIRPILAAQLVYTDFTAAMLDYTTTVWKKPNKHYFYAVSGAPYYGMTKPVHERAVALRKQVDDLNAAIEKANAVPNAVQQALYDVNAPEYSISVDELLSSFSENANDSVNRKYEANIVMARKHQIKFVAYEGGLDTFGSASVLNKAAANRRPEIKGTCIDHINTWARNGGDLMLWFNAGAGTWNSSFGTWSLSEQPFDTDSHKIKCMDEVSTTAAPQEVSRHRAPGSFSAGETARVNGTASGMLENLATEMEWGGTANQSRDYAVSSTTEAEYDLFFTITVAAATPKTSLPLEVWVNGERVITGPTTMKGVPNVAEEVKVGRIKLPAGISALTIKQNATLGFRLSVIALR